MISNGALSYQQEYDDRIAHFYTLPWYHQLYHHLVGGMETVKTFWEAYTDEYQILVNTGAQIGPDSAGPDRITSLRYRRLEGPAYSGFTNARSVRFWRVHCIESNTDRYLFIGC